jgi:hypothetical protein
MTKKEEKYVPKPLRKKDGTLPQKHSEVVQILSELEINKTYRLSDIIATINMCLNLKSKTYQWLREASKDFVANQSYDPNLESTVLLDDLYVDMTYQRRVRLNHLMKKLKKRNGFLKAVAGCVDVAVRCRSNKSFVWDGLRRCLMVGILGGECIGTSIYAHPAAMGDIDCRKTEAVFFEVRNAEGEGMTAEEIFKAQVASKDKVALELLDLMQECNLTVESLNPNGVSLGGFVQFQKAFKNDFYTKDSLITASEMLQEVYPNTSLSGYLLTGLSYLLEHNSTLNGQGYDEVDEDDSILAKMKDFVATGAVYKFQTLLTTKRLNGKAQECIAWNIATHVLNDGGALSDLLLTGDDTVEMENYTENAVEFESAGA